MGEVRVCAQPSNAVFGEDTGPRTLILPSGNPNYVNISAENWILAEELTEKLIRKVQPTKVADEKRREISEHVRSLIRGVSYAEVFPSGSVPLRTYLPDGDIDLTVITRQGTEDYLLQMILAFLQDREQKGDCQPEIKDVQFINAEVKVVKCLVDSIMVDISFHQPGGLCSLCFLEEMDQIIGKNHLFKRSIILIKAWCYYESRILGSHYSLLSSYALETLVLYIFHAYHASLDGPLSVLYRFLDFFGQFDWENYCIGLNGPVPLSSLPEITADLPKAEDGPCLPLSNFLKKYKEEFFPSLLGLEGNSSSRSFQKRHINIIDPLKASNNLGRSVNKGNSYRIRSAFAYGARKLGRILTLPKERVSMEINMFFINLLDGCEGMQLHGQDASFSTITSHQVADSESTQKTNGSSPRRVIYAPHEFFRRDEDKSDLNSRPIELGESSPLLDLSGDYDTHERNIQYALNCLKTPLPPLLYSGSQLDGPCQVNKVKSLNPNWFLMGSFPPALMVPSVYSPSRGTGTYIPNMSHLKCRERDPPNAQDRERKGTSGKVWRHGPSQTKVDQSATPAVIGLTQSSNLSSPPHEPLTASRKDDPPVMVGSSKEERKTKHSSYQLKNDADFPPLMS